jgi:branched-chain amino acid transport system ATP-binding protein
VHDHTGTQDDGAAVLILRGVSRQFGGLRVIQDLQLDVAKGEIVGILGPNGAGKSTLFNLISSVLTPDRGTVVYNGRDVTRLELWDRRRLGIGQPIRSRSPSAT